MSALYMEVNPRVDPSRLISELAVALQDKREVYVCCDRGEADEVERLLRAPFERRLTLGPLFDPEEDGGEERVLVHELLQGDRALLSRLLANGVTRPSEREPSPEEPKDAVTELTQTLNALLVFLKRELWEWYAQEVKVSRAHSKERATFYCEQRELESLKRRREIPF